MVPDSKILNGELFEVISVTGLKKEPTFLENVKSFLRGFLKMGVAPNTPTRCIGCGRCGPAQPCPFGVPKEKKLKNVVHKKE